MTSRSYEVKGFVFNKENRAKYELHQRRNLNQETKTSNIIQDYMISVICFPKKRVILINYSRKEVIYSIILFYFYEAKVNVSL